jgi:hypothetical protein
MDYDAGLPKCLSNSSVVAIPTMLFTLVRLILVMAIPCLILFLLLQRHVVRGFMAGALKG